MTTLVHVKGLDELQKALKQFPIDVTKKVLKSRVAAGGRVIRDAAIANIGSDPKNITGTLRRAAYVRFLASESNDTQVEYIVGFRQGKSQRKKGKDAFYARFVEFGHKIVPRSAKITSIKGYLRNKRTLRTRRQAATSSVDPHRFLGPAFDSAGQAALQKMISTMEKGIDRLIK